MEYLRISGGGSLVKSQVDAAASEVSDSAVDGGGSSSGVNGVLKLGRRTKEEDARRE